MDTDDRKMLALVVAVVVAVALFVVWLIGAAVRSDSTYAEWCQAQGGHVDSTSHTSVVNTFTNGAVGVGTVTTSTTFCLGPNGNIIDVRG